MSDIEDLYQIILSGIGRSFDDMAEKIIAAGFHRDRTITTAEELDALPANSVVIDGDGSPWRSGFTLDGGLYWWMAGRGIGVDSSRVLRDGPVMVVWTPEGES